MGEYRFSLTRVFPYGYRIIDSVHYLLSINFTKWSNTLKCLSVFYHFVKLALKGLNVKIRSGTTRIFAYFLQFLKKPENIICTWVTFSICGGTTFHLRLWWYCLFLLYLFRPRFSHILTSDSIKQEDKKPLQRIKNTKKPLKNHCCFPHCQKSKDPRYSK